MTKKTHRQLFLSSPLSPRELSRPCPCFVAASSSSSLAGFGTTPTVSTSLSPSSTTTRTTMPSTSSTTTRTTMPSTPSSGEGHLHHSYWQACVFSQSLPDLKMKWTIILVKKTNKFQSNLLFCTVWDWSQSWLWTASSALPLISSVDVLDPWFCHGYILFEIFA